MLFQRALSLSFLAYVAALVTPPNDWAKLTKLGANAPYHKAPAPRGVKQNLPPDCKVKQVVYLSRHGSRYPGFEGTYVSAMAQTVTNAQPIIANVRLPREFRFLKTYTSTLGSEDLVDKGRQEMIHHGKEFRKRYPHFNFDHFVTSGSSRVIESATYFGKGYFGPNWNDPSKISPIPSNPATLSHLTPFQVCPNHSFSVSDSIKGAWQNVFMPAITERINAAVPGLNFADIDTLGGFYACAFDYAAHGVSPWCGAFTKQEIDQFEYYADLDIPASWGFMHPQDMGRVMGSVYTNKLIERLSASDENIAYVELGHDATIAVAMTAMGLAKDDPPLLTTHMVSDRKMRSSNQVPFGGQMVFEKFTCSRSFEGPQVRLILNEATYPLTPCIQSARDAKYGTCSLSNFIQSNQFSMSIEFGDAQWAASCGVPA
ncbi:histidine acid phosphatase family protein [Pleurotus pulmonarius]